MNTGAGTLTVHTDFIRRGEFRAEDLSADVVALVDQALDQAETDTLRCTGCQRVIHGIDRLEVAAVARFSDASPSVVLAFCRWCASSSQAQIDRMTTAALMARMPGWQITT